MVDKSFVPLTAMLTILLLLTHTGLSFARSLSSLEDSYWLDNIDKRNSWWSKKSVEDFNRLSPQEFRHYMSKRRKDESIEDRPGERRPPNLYSCYVENCVPDFIECSRTSEIKEIFAACKLQHRACAKHCWNISNDGRL